MIDIPVNITSESSPFPIFTKYNFSFPLGSLLESLNVEAKPEPPCEAIVVVAASRERALRIAGSIFGAIFASGLDYEESITLKRGRLDGYRKIEVVYGVTST